MRNNFTIREVQEFWDKASGIYEKTNQKISDTHLQRFKEALKYMALKPGQKVLNVWSRTGLAIPYLREKCSDIEIQNLEASAKFIGIAREKFKQEIFKQTDLEKIPFADNYFDYILSLETLEHVPGPAAFLKELHRVIKPEGTMVMSLPPATAEISLKIYELFFENHGEGPHKFLSSKKVKQLLKESGFKLLKHRGTLLIPVGPKWLKNAGEKLINFFQNTPLRELGIRQFYICKK